eukprot:gene3177-biopygen15716
MIPHRPSQALCSRGSGGHARYSNKVQNCLPGEGCAATSSIRLSPRLLERDPPHFRGGMRQGPGGWFPQEVLEVYGILVQCLALECLWNACVMLGLCVESWCGAWNTCGTLGVLVECLEYLWDA